jgi:class 3 adenylate cyclase
VVNLAARLCSEAKAGQILIPPRVHNALENLIKVEPVGELTLKGFSKPIAAQNVISLLG